MSNIKKDMLSGVWFTAIAKYSGIIVQILVSAILSRLLTPDDFGVIALVTVTIGFFGIFSNIGLGTAVVQNRTLTKHDLDHIYSFTVYLGLFLGILFFCSSWWIANYYDNSNLVLLCQIMSTNLLISSITTVPTSLLSKNKRFKYIAYWTLIIQIISAIISISMAYKGCGYFSLLVSPILGGLVTFLINYRQYPLTFYLKIDFCSIRKVASYSFYQFLFSTSNYFSRNLDNLIIGKSIGLDSLGYYQKSYQLMTLPVSNLTHVVTPVLHPIFAEYQNDLKFICDKYTKVVHLLAYAGFPVSVILFFCAEELITIVYGSQWAPSIPVFEILSMTVWCQVTGSSIGAVFQVTGQTKSLFYKGLANTKTTICGFIVAALYFKTIESMAWAWLITSYINNYTWWYVYRFLFKTSTIVLVRAMLPAFLWSIGLAAILYGIESINLNVASFPNLIIKGTISAIYIIIMLHISKILAFHIIYNNIKSTIKRTIFNK